MMCSLFCVLLIFCWIALTFSTNFPTDSSCVGEGKGFLLKVYSSLLYIASQTVGGCIVNGFLSIIIEIFRFIFLNPLCKIQITCLRIFGGFLSFSAVILNSTLLWLLCSQVAHVSCIWTNILMVMCKKTEIINETDIGFGKFQFLGGVLCLLLVSWGFSFAVIGG